MVKHTKNMKNKENQITVYWTGEFFGSVIKKEGTLIEHGTRKYAQYNNAPFVKMIPARKRNGVMIAKEYNPFILVLEGVGHPEPEGMWKSSQPVNGVTVTESRYSSFDDRWVTDFDKMIDAYVAENKVKVIADYRYTKGFSSHSKTMSTGSSENSHDAYVDQLKSKGLNEEQVSEMVKRSSI